MARYRGKDETDLRWNRVRRIVTRELDRQIHDWREEALNKLLGDAWQKFAAALESGEKMELESAYDQFVRKALTGKTSIDLKDV